MGKSETLRRGQHAALVVHLAVADQRQRHVAQRREVAGRADRTLARDDRDHVGVPQRDRLVEQLPAHARVAEREVVDAQGKREPRRVDRQRVADAGRVAQQQVLLQLRQLLNSLDVLLEAWNAADSAGGGKVDFPREKMFMQAVRSGKGRGFDP